MSWYRQFVPAQEVRQRSRASPAALGIAGTPSPPASSALAPAQRAAMSIVGEPPARLAPTSYGKDDTDPEIPVLAVQLMMGARRPATTPSGAPPAPTAAGNGGKGAPQVPPSSSSCAPGASPGRDPSPPPQPTAAAAIPMPPPRRGGRYAGSPPLPAARPFLLGGGDASMTDSPCAAAAPGGPSPWRPSSSCQPASASTSGSSTGAGAAAAAPQAAAGPLPPVAPPPITSPFALAEAGPATPAVDGPGMTLSRASSGSSDADSLGGLELLPLLQRLERQQAALAERERAAPAPAPAAVAVPAPPAAPRPGTPPCPPPGGGRLPAPRPGCAPAPLAPLPMKRPAAGPAPRPTPGRLQPLSTSQGPTGGASSSSSAAKDSWPEWDRWSGAPMSRSGSQVQLTSLAPGSGTPRRGSPRSPPDSPHSRGDMASIAMDLHPGLWLTGGLLVAGASAGAVVAAHALLALFIKAASAWTVAWTAATGVTGAQGMCVGTWAFSNRDKADAAEAAAAAAAAQRARAAAAAAAGLDAARAAAASDAARAARVQDALQQAVAGLTAENQRLLAAVEVRAEHCALTRATARVQGDVGQLLRMVRDVREDLMCLASSATASADSAGGPPAAAAAGSPRGGGSGSGGPPPPRLLSRGSVDASLCAAVCDGLGWAEAPAGGSFDSACGSAAAAAAAAADVLPGLGGSPVTLGGACDAGKGAAAAVMDHASSGGSEASTSTAAPATGGCA